MSLALDVQYATETEAPAEDELMRWISAAVRSDQPLEVALRIVDEAESAHLNETYRDKRGATNVLAFEGNSLIAEDLRLLGDIVICAPLVVAEARQQGKPAHAHWAHLLVHGTLHLQGFKHDTPAEAAIMEAAEVDILARLGYSNPYQAENSAATERDRHSPS